MRKISGNKGAVIGVVTGNTGGLKKNHLRLLTRLAGKRVQRDLVIGADLAGSLCRLSSELNRQIGILVHRSGKIESVIVGEYAGIMIPRLSHVRTSGGRLRGLRLIHTHLAGEDISDEDLMDLLFLRLDILSVLKVNAEGLPERLYSVHLLPTGRKEKWRFCRPVHPARQEESFEELITALEAEFSKTRVSRDIDKGDRALLISVSAEPRIVAEESVAELEELARSGNVRVLDKVIQRRRTTNPALYSGEGQTCRYYAPGVATGRQPAHL